MIHNHISHSASHPGWSQLYWEFIQVNSKYVWAQDSPLPHPIGYSKGGWVVGSPFYLHGLDNARYLFFNEKFLLLKDHSKQF